VTGGSPSPRPGPRAPARFVCAALALAALAQPGGAALAQAPPAAAAPALPVPDEATSLKMLWSAMAAVDHANRTGNYSVLRDLGSPAFQANNNAANLAAIFAGLRGQDVDLSATLLATPAWDIAPTMIQPRMLRMRGRFALRPAGIAFDLLFTWDSAWRIEGIAVQALPDTAAAPGR